MKHQRELIVAETRLIGIGPQELIRSAERIHHKETILDKPALQKLVVQAVGVVGHQAQAGCPSERGAIEVGLGVTQIDRNAEFVFGGPVRGGIVARNQINRQVRKVIGRVVTQVDLQIVANGMQDLEQGVNVRKSRNG